ncbi:UDP-Glycosyltransferase/glycogen phosphorylase [Trichoderma asperelloides]|nr:UDP-Glycosyltransferase/glycogen phosphorylase [Trichoderma asperelloides]
MDGQHSPWNYGQVFNTSGESSESVLQFDASFSGSRGTSRTSEHDPGGMPSLDLTSSGEEMLGLGSIRDISLPQNKSKSKAFFDYCSIQKFSVDRITLRKQTRWRRLVDTVLCPYFHGYKFPSEALRAEEGWLDYYFMMECFANKICDIYKPGDIIMVHDYHLIMLPRLLRQRLPGAYLAFSLHTPCRALTMPWPLRGIFEGILRSNTITFQASEDVMDFIVWCARRPPDHSSYWATRAMDVCTVLPMGIDVSSVISAAQSQAARKQCESLRRAFKDRKIVVSYNTLDTRAEMADVAMGFDRMLTQMPQRKERVVLLQLEFHALLQASDAVIFPSTPGGSMTAALEYSVCRSRDNKRPIISDMNPVTRQIPGPITYRRGDIDSIARAISYALVLPNRSPMGKLHLEEYNFGIMNTAERWTNSVLHYLTEKLLPGRTLVDTSDGSTYGS